MSELLVFVSSIMDKAREDLYAERDAAKRAIESLELTRAWRFEDSPASSLRVDYSYLNRVAESDIFVLLLGRELTNPVRLEYHAAVDAGKPVLAFLKSGARTPEADELVKSLTVKWKAFDSVEALQREVRSALAEELVEAHRRQSIELDPADLHKLSANIPAASVAAASNAIAVGRQSGGVNVGAGARVSGPVAGGNVHVTETRTAGRDFYEAHDQAVVNVTQGADVQDVLALLQGMKAAVADLGLAPHDEKRVQYALAGAALEAEAPKPDRGAVATRLKEAADIARNAGAVVTEASKFGRLLKQALTWAGVAVSALL